MAKLLAPFSLCPLIEQRKCLGVCEDSIPGCIIVTLGKRMVIRFRLSDQKQVGTWSPNEKLSAPVLYDFLTKRYIAVFKSDHVACWLEPFSNFSKLKKFKFSRLIFSLLCTKECSPIVIYQDGSIGMLCDEISSRKSEKKKGFLENVETILLANLVQISECLYVNLLTFNKRSKVKSLYFLPVDADRADTFKISLQERSTGSFKAHTFNECEYTSLITLWSDGSIYSVELPPKGVNSFPGRIISKIEQVNLLQEIAMNSIGEHEIVIYGAAPNCEGAVICVYNLKYGLIGSLQKLKVYNDVPHLWSVGGFSNNRYILCLSGGHLVVFPIKFVTQRLCTVIGVKKGHNTTESNGNDLSFSPLVNATWSKTKDTLKCAKMDLMEVDDNVHELNTLILNMRNDGFSDHMICKELLPKFIEKMDELQILLLLTLVNDVPDTSLIDLATKFNKESSNETILKKVIHLPLVSDNSSLQLVRSKIDLPSAFRILTLMFGMIDNQKFNRNLLDWACLLLDSHYQQYLLSQDETIIRTIKEMYNVVMHQVESLTCIKTLYMDLVSLKKGHIHCKKRSISSHSYIVDCIDLY